MGYPYGNFTLFYAKFSMDPIMKRLKLAGLVLLCTLTACNNDDNKVDTSAHAQTLPNSNNNPKTQHRQSVNLKILLNDLRIRHTPSLNGKVIDKLKENTVVEWLGEISQERHRIKLRGVQFKEPWLKIKTPSGKQGWAYAAATLPISDSNYTDALRNKLYTERAMYFFGDKVGQAVVKYRLSYQQAQTDQQLARAYSDIRLHRPALVENLRKKAEINQPAMDMSWIEYLMPGFKVVQVAEGTVYYPTANFVSLANKAKTTQGQTDDEFFAFCQRLFPYNGLEGFFANWFEQTWDYGGESLLGQGKHLAALQEMDQLFRQSSFFAQTLKHYKNDLVHDITYSETKFRESKDKIKRELQQILAKNFSILTSADKKSIKERYRNL